jgi:hypothetical protein
MNKLWIVDDWTSLINDKLSASLCETLHPCYGEFYIVFTFFDLFIWVHWMSDVTKYEPVTSSLERER